MSTSVIVLLVVFLALFVQLWFVNFLHKAFIIMLSTRYEKTYLVSPTMSLEHLTERTKLLDQYQEELKKFMRKLFTTSLIVNGIVTLSTIYYLAS
jgi:hypothetical protein